TVDYDREMVIDDVNQMFYVQQFTVDNPQIFRFDEILGFEMRLGYHAVETWSRGMKRTPYKPPALGLASGISMLAEAFGADDDDDVKDSKYETIKVILQVNTKYLKEYELCDLSVSGRGAAEFEHDFSRELAKADAACNLIVSMASGGVQTSGPDLSQTEPVVSSADKTTDGIKKFKELLDAGIITQEEFNAKKKQLLGI
ncbi:MAG: SHOCT domain-containing protein, partial [Oscillospiraceae bacterium]